MIILQKEKALKSIGGVFIPETTRGEKPQEGIILEVSDDVQTGVVRGDHVVFSKYSGSVIEIDRLAVLVLHEEDIIALRKPDDSN